MSPRTGRPTDNPKGTSIHVRLDKKCEEILNAYCEQEKVSKMEATRRGIKKLEPDLKNREQLALWTVQLLLITPEVSLFVKSYFITGQDPHSSKDF